MSKTEQSSSENAKPAPTVFPERTQFDLSAFPCPRCQKTMAADTYAPCADCIAELRASQQSEATGESAAAYEPKMNVTPNAVALKED